MFFMALAWCVRWAQAGRVRRRPRPTFSRFGLRSAFAATLASSQATHPSNTNDMVSAIAEIPEIIAFLAVSRARRHPPTQAPPSHLPHPAQPSLTSYSHDLLGTVKSDAPAVSVGCTGINSDGFGVGSNVATAVLVRTPLTVDDSVTGYAPVTLSLLLKHIPSTSRTAAPDFRVALWADDGSTTHNPGTMVRKVSWLSEPRSPNARPPLQLGKPYTISLHNMKGLDDGMADAVRG